jgi:hypothetical protein
MSRWLKRDKAPLPVQAERPDYVVQPTSAAGYRIVGATGTVDVHFTHSAADYFARLLNAGQATLDMHACIGSRVVEVS